MAFVRPENAQGDVKAQWSNESAFNLPLALQESQKWIEAVTSTKFKNPQNFQESTKDGFLLCTLLNQISPGIVKKINPQKTAFADRENLSFFIEGCKKLGLRSTQLFVSNDLYEGQRIRSVAITLYWLGRAARAVPSYKGPQLDITSFAKINCTKCRKPIDKGTSYVVTLDQQWHTECAQCDNCHKKLDPKEGYVPDGPKIFCPPCANRGGGGGSPSNRGAPTGANKGAPAATKPAGPNCPVCSKAVSGPPSVEAGDKKFHKPCFKCTDCNKPLDQAKPQSYVIAPGTGKPYCDQHGPEHICPGCGEDTATPGKGPIAQIGPQKWHQNCFKCHECQKPFPNNKFYDIDGNNYCDNCKDHPHHHHPGHGHDHGHHHHGEPYDPNKCATCSKPLSQFKKGAPLEAFDKKYCPLCYCNICSRLFREEEWYYPDDKNQIAYCPTCYDDGKVLPSNQGRQPATGPGCTTCKQPLAGKEFLESGKPAKPYCPDCFCGNCQKLLGDGERYYPDGSKAYCEPCAAPKGYPKTPAAAKSSPAAKGGPAGKSGPGAGGPGSGAGGPGQPTGGPCAQCNKPTLNRETIKKDGKPYCPDCHCSNCSKVLPTGTGKQTNPAKDQYYCPQCVNKPSSDSCSSCGEPVTSPPKGAPASPGAKSAGGPPVEACGKKFHKPCFNCDNCHKAIDPTKDKEVTVSPTNGKPWCGPCSADKNCPTCGKELSGPVVKANDGKKYHQPCYVCNSCKGPFPEGKVFNVGGKPVCKDCKDGPGNRGAGAGDKGPCGGCNKPVKGNGINALDKPWHPECFNCTNCHKPFPNGNYVDVGNKPYCEPCANQHGGDRGHGGNPEGYVEGVTPCAGCGHPLQGQVTEVYNQFWHFGCFKCDRCRASLEDGFLQWEQRPYCDDCYKVVSTNDKCHKCAKPIHQGKIAKVRSNLYHEECCTCGSCGKKLSSATPGIGVKFSVPYCKDCYPKVHKPTAVLDVAASQSKATTTTTYGPRTAGFTVDPRTGQKKYSPLK